MKDWVSKERSRRARQRHKQAGRQQASQGPLRDHVAIGFSVVIAVWAVLSMFMVPVESWHRFTHPDMYLPALGKAMVGLVAFFCAGLLLNVTEPLLLKRNSRLILMALIILITSFFGRFVYSLSDFFDLLHPETVRFLLPFTMAALLTIILLGLQAGIAMGLLSALLFYRYTGNDWSVLFCGVTATLLVAAMACNRIRTRARVVKLALITGVAQFLILLAATLFVWDTVGVLMVLHQAAACIMGALVSALSVLLILPLLEHVFGITSDISLLEFSDLGHPLLQRLALEAPGTYHHSLVVANIAQAAAEAIGANSLEARVASYFHDIGKLTKPGFFAENIHLKENPHDSLPPSMSTLIITAHVKEGLSLALLHKLPEAVQRAIREHHGSSMLQCFHHKAVNQLELEMEETRHANRCVDDNHFRYPGPRPSTRVSAIICLADAVEAASRSLEKPTPGHLENLVNEIVRKRFDDGQLDECDLTLLDLARVKKAFVFTLTTMLHGRVAYPKDETANS